MSTELEQAKQWQESLKGIELADVDIKYPHGASIIEIWKKETQEVFKTFKVGDKVKITKKCNCVLTNFRDFLKEIIDYKLDYLVVNKVKDKNNSWQVGLKRDDGVVLIHDAFMFEDLEHYEEYNETFNPEAHSSLIVDFDKEETIEEAAFNLGNYPSQTENFIKGAKSSAARNHWFKIFQEEQKGQEKF